MRQESLLSLSERRQSERRQSERRFSERRLSERRLESIWEGDAPKPQAEGHQENIFLGLGLGHIAFASVVREFPLVMCTALRVMTPPMQTPGPSNGEARPLKGPQQQPIWRAQKTVGTLREGNLGTHWVEIVSAVPKAWGRLHLVFKTYSPKGQFRFLLAPFGWSPQSQTAAI